MNDPTILTLFDPSGPVGALLLGIVMLFVGMALAAVTRRALRDFIRHDQSERVDQITVTVISHLAVLGMWLLLLIIYAHMVPVLNKLGTTLLAGAGLASVIIGFAAQTTLGNLIAGISLVLYKPFRRGDRIQVTAPNTDQFDVGTVENITLGFTQLKTDDGREILIANGAMIQQTIIKLAPAPKPVTAKAKKPA